jgi:alpha-tubulin suppressor-like RCC1 family protein
MSPGECFSTGFNSTGQLGLGDTTNRNTFTEVLNPNNVSELSGGYRFSLALANDGRIWATGDNSYGQLGLGNYAGVNK